MVKGLGGLTSVNYLNPAKIRSFTATLARILFSTYLESGVICITCFYFQVWLDPASLCSVPCHLLTATSTKCVTTPAAMTSPTGCPALLPCPWHRCPRRRSSHTSADVLSARPQHRQWHFTARTSQFLPAH